MYEKTYKSSVLKQNSKNTPSSKRYFPWRRVFITIIILGLIYGLCFMLRHPKFQVDTISVLGTNVLDEQDVSSSIKEQLNGKLLWIFPKTSVLLVNDKKIEHNLINQFSRIEDISVKRTNLHTIVATIKEFDAVYLWCTKETENCYFMDKNANVYSKAPVFSGTAYPKVFTDAPLEPLPFLGLKPDDLERLSVMQKKLSEINITPVAFHFVSSREIQIDFLHNKSTAKLLIDPTIPTDTSLEYLFSGIRTQPLADLFHNGNKKLLYIDVRFSNKVVYKFDSPEEKKE